MDDQVPFKVFTFWSEKEKPEVRRFGVEKSLVSSFVYLNAKLQEVFPGLKGNSYAVSWKDEEGDDITVSSDEEMMTALTSIHGDLVKLYVYCKNGEPKEDVCEFAVTAFPPEAFTPRSSVHYGVLCDGCDSSIVGFRYKCTVCDDFDLCSKCECSGMHPEHCMVRVPTPAMPRTVIKAAIKRSRHFLKTVSNTVGEDCPFKKHRSEKTNDKKHGQHSGDHHRGDHHRGEHHRGDRHRRQRTSWLETFATYMNEFANLAGDIDLDADKKAKNPAPTQEKKPASENQTPEQPKQEPETDQVTSDDDQCPLQALTMQNLQKLVEMYVGHNIESLLPQPGTSNDASVNTNEVPKNNASVSTDVEMGQGDVPSVAPVAPVVDTGSVKSESSASSFEVKRDESTDKADDWTMINEEKEVEGDLLASSPLQPAANHFDLPEEFREHVKITENLYPPLNVATAEHGCLVPQVASAPEPAQEPKPAPQPKATQTPRPAQPQYPQPTQYRPYPQQAQFAPKPQYAQQRPAQSKPGPAPVQHQPPRLHHPTPHIDAAVQQMLAMGFTNDGGWLTQLLESKDGNIAAVLDLLTPVNPKK